MNNRTVRNLSGCIVLKAARSAWSRRPAWSLSGREMDRCNNMLGLILLAARDDETVPDKLEFTNPRQQSTIVNGHYTADSIGGSLGGKVRYFVNHFNGKAYLVFTNDGPLWTKYGLAIEQPNAEMLRVIEAVLGQLSPYIVEVDDLSYLD